MNIKKILRILLLLVILGIIIFVVIMSIKLKQITKMTFEDMVLYTTQNNKDATISVGIIKDGEISYKVYGENGKSLNNLEYEYEIGSITKTITTAFLSKTVMSNKANFDDSIDKYLNLNKQDYYPTLKKIITHTSGYKSYYFESQMIKNFFSKHGNSFNGVTNKQILGKANNIKLKDKDYEFNYSNFGLAIIGNVLETIYNDNYTNLITKFVKDDLNMPSTKISNNQDKQNYWFWQDNDGYRPSGALISNIKDMTTYLELNVYDKKDYLTLSHQPLASPNKSEGKYGDIDIRIDNVGAGWMIDNENNIIWHNGATSHFNSYLGFDKQKQIGVVILSNLAPKYRIPTTLMGIKLIKELKTRENVKYELPDIG